MILEPNDTWTLSSQIILEPHTYHLKWYLNSCCECSITASLLVVLVVRSIAHCTLYSLYSDAMIAQTCHRHTQAHWYLGVWCCNYQFRLLVQLVLWHSGSLPPFHIVPNRLVEVVGDSNPETKWSHPWAIMNRYAVWLLPTSQCTCAKRSLRISGTGTCSPPGARGLGAAA